MRVGIALVMLTVATPVYAQTVGSTSGASSIVDINNPANTTAHVITAPTVAAPGLAAAGIETCLGSASGGLSVMGGGITFGATKVDEGCTIRLLARQLFAFGLHKAALALMCQDRRVATRWTSPGRPARRPRPTAASISPAHRKTCRHLNRKSSAHSRRRRHRFATTPVATLSISDMPKTMRPSKRHFILQLRRSPRSRRKNKPGSTEPRTFTDPASSPRRTRFRGGLRDEPIPVRHK